MRTKLITLIILSMVVLGALFGFILYRAILVMSENLLFHCIIMGGLYGLLNSIIALLFIKKYIDTKAKNQMLDFEIRKDKLTGLYNRYAFDNDIRVLSTNSIYSMIFLDIDNFRDFNNIYGHQIGDKILIECANIIKNNLKHTDFAYRYGGDEIVIILPDCKKDKAKKIAHNISECIYHYDIAPYPSPSISAGLASMPEDARCFNQLIRISDLAMVKAKSNGKNRVFVYAEDF